MDFCSHVKYVLFQFLGILGDRDSVLVYDAVDALMILLQFNELPESSKIISQMNVSCGLKTKKNPFHYVYLYI